VLPFDLPTVSRGFAAVTPAARALGARVTVEACHALGRLLGGEVAVAARPVPGTPAPRAAAARLGLDLPALPGTATVEAEPALVVALVDALAGGPGGHAAATALTPVEAAAFELLVLEALDGACAVPEVEAALAPRLSRRPVEPPAALAVELDVSAPGASGRARLLLPPAAVRAVAGPPPTAGPALALRVAVSVRSGRAAVSAGELAALAAGDVLLLDPPAAGDGALVLPGGARLRGRYEPDGFHVEEPALTTSERNALVPILLEIELARVEIPLGELARLEPGAVLPLNLDRRGLVTLRVGERALGRGELVDVEGSVGVRVHALEGLP
jgi:type III secretion protein Q